MALQAYFDESGIHEGSHVCAIAGYIGRKKQWDVFKPIWSKTLRDFGVEMFHAKQFFAKDPTKARVGPYAGWSDEYANAFLQRLIGAINKAKLHAVSCSLVMSEWNKLPEHERRYLTGGQWRNGEFTTSGCPGQSYFCPFLNTVVDAAHLCKGHERAHFFYALNTDFSGYARNFFAETKGNDALECQPHLGQIAFPTMKESPSLQAADLFAYLLHWYGWSRMQHETATPKPLLSSLLKRLDPHSNPFLDKEGLDLLLADFRPKFRRASGRASAVRSATV